MHTKLLSSIIISITNIVGPCIKKKKLIQIFNRINMRNLEKIHLTQCEDIIKKINSSDPEEEIFKLCPRAKLTKWKRLWDDIKSFHGRKLKYWKNQLISWNGAVKLIVENKNPIVHRVYESFQELYKNQMEWIKEFLGEMGRLEMVDVRAFQDENINNDEL